MRKVLPIIKIIVTAAVLLTSFNNAALADLLSASRANDQADVLSWLREGVDVNQPMVDGTTALHWAVYNQNVELVEALIAAGAEVNVKNDYGSSPMSEAGVIGHAEILKMLLDAGADVESPTLEGQTALMSVVRTPNIEAAELLIAQGANVNAFETWRGQTVLMFASAQSQPAMVKLLLEHGANPDTISVVEEWPRQVTNEPRPQNRPFGGFTALLYSAREGCAECAQALVDGGADLNLVDPNVITPLLMATLNARWDVAMVLIDAGADVNRWDTWGRAPLYSTVDYNTVPRGGRPDRPSLDNAFPVDVAKALLEKGANPDMQLKLFPPYRSLGADRGGDGMLSAGTTPLIRAAKGGDIEMVELLLEYGADPVLRNWAGHTPMTAASGIGTTNIDIRSRFREEHNNIETAKLLMKAGADINGPDGTGRRPIHGATSEGWNDFIRFLVENGADINIEDNQGYTAMDIAMGRARTTGRFASLIEPKPETAGLILELGGKAGSSQQ